MTETEPVAVVYTPASTMWITGVCAGLLVAMLGGITIMGFINGEDLTWAAWLTLLVAAAWTFALLKQKIDRTLLFADRVERKGIFATQSMPLSDIAGFRLSAYAVTLVSGSSQVRSLRLTPEILQQAQFAEWLRTLRDLDKKDDTASAPEGDAALPARKHTILVSRIVGGFSLLGALWAWGAPSPVSAPFAMAGPLIALALQAWRSDAFTLLQLDRDDNVSRRMFESGAPPRRRDLAFVWVLSCLVTALAASELASARHLFEASNMPLIVVLALPMLGAFAALDKNIRTWNNLIPTVIFLAIWAWGAIILLRHVL